MTLEMIETIRKLAESHDFKGVPIPQLCKMAARYAWLRDSDNAYPLFFIAQRDPHGIVVQFRGDLADMNLDAMISRQDGTDAAERKESK